MVGVAFAVLAAIRVGRERGWRPGLAGAALLVAALSCFRSFPGRSATRSSSTASCRSRPAAARRSTSAPSCPPTANTSGSRRCWSQRYLHRDLDPGSEALDRVDPTPLFDRVADRYPDLPRDSALGKIGKQNFSKYFGEDPLGYAAMTVRKVWRMWSGGVGEAMSSGAGRVVQVLIVAARPGRARRARLRRRWWELVAMATPIAARHRRRSRLAGGAAAQRGPDDTCLSACRRWPWQSRVRALSSSGSWSPRQASSPPS